MSDASLLGNEGNLNGVAHGGATARWPHCLPFSSPNVYLLPMHAGLFPPQPHPSTSAAESHKLSGRPRPPAAAYIDTYTHHM